jgi:hypothetical protein
MQNNLISENDLGEVQQATLEAGIEVQEIRIIPFSDEIPEFTYNKKNFYYGSTTLMKNIYEQLCNPLGLFYDDYKFSMRQYMRVWGEHMLNHGSFFYTVDNIICNPDKVFTNDDDNYFMRPDGDGKEFDGQVGTRDELLGTLERHMAYEGPLNYNSMILIGKAYNIFKEWRLYIVGGEIITASKYRQDFKLSKSATDIPEDMLTFARNRIKEYIPHENFAMDIASTHDGEYYIIECGCLNSVGFYHADINKLFKSIVDWMRKQ